MFFSRKKARLLRHDRAIVANELRSALSSWNDRLIALAGLLIALVAVRSALSHRPFLFAATAVAALAATVGAGAARMVERRLDFHSQDGVLAADALAEDARRDYALSIHALVCGTTTLCAMIVRPAAAVVAPIGYLIGAGISHVSRRVVATGSSPRRSFSLRAFARLPQRPISGVLAAIPVVLPLLLLGSIEPRPMAVVVGLVSAVAVLLLTMLDYNVVRFMTESGYGAGRIIVIHSRSTLIFLIVAVAASVVLSDEFVAVVIFGVVLAAVIFVASRVLANRIQSKRAADTLVSICAGIVCVTAVSIPLLLPVVVIGILWHLHRHAGSATWQLT